MEAEVEVGAEDGAPKVTDAERGQVAAEAAVVYDEFFVPALFEQWARPVADAARVRRGHEVLDVACGTGALTRVLAELAGPDGRTVGLDPNQAMLDVARRAAPGIEWHLGRAEALPFAPATFDAAVSQFGLMFFEDRAAAVAEMRRVVRPGGAVAVAVWGPIEASPGYAALAGLLADLFGPSAAAALRVPFVLGDADAVVRLLRSAGFPTPDVQLRRGIARFPSLEAWMHTEIRGWTLAGEIDDEGFEQLLSAARIQLAGFVLPDGRVEFDVPAIIASAERPAEPPGP